MNEDLFNDYLANRAEMFGKKINTERAVKSLRLKMKGWEDIGYNVDKIIQHAIDVGWRGLFIPQGMEPKQKHLKPHSALGGLAKGIGTMPKPKTQRQKHDHANKVRSEGAAALEEMKRITGAN